MYVTNLSSFKFIFHIFVFYSYISGADPGFQVRGVGAHLKKLRRAEGGAKIFWGISCEKSRFYAKKSYFFRF